MGFPLVAHTQAFACAFVEAPVAFEAADSETSFEPKAVECPVAGMGYTFVGVVDASFVADTGYTFVVAVVDASFVVALMATSLFAGA